MLTCLLCDRYTLFGCKRWILFHPEDTALLYPDWSHGGLHPRFPSLHALQAQPEKYPLFKQARRREVVRRTHQLSYSTHPTLATPPSSAARTTRTGFNCMRP